jgi:hypothetical protein
MNSVELPATISLYSGKGETVLIKKLFDRESVIHLHKFTNGIYYMKVNSVNGKVYTEKINLIH